MPCTMGFATVGAFASFAGVFSQQAVIAADIPPPAAVIQFATTAPMPGQPVETALSGTLPDPSYRWISWPACGSAADGAEVGTGASLSAHTRLPQRRLHGWRFPRRRAKAMSSRAGRSWGWMSAPAHGTLSWPTSAILLSPECRVVQDIRDVRSRNWRIREAP